MRHFAILWMVFAGTGIVSGLTQRIHYGNIHQKQKHNLYATEENDSSNILSSSDTDAALTLTKNKKERKSLDDFPYLSAVIKKEDEQETSSFVQQSERRSSSLQSNISNNINDTIILLLGSSSLAYLMNQMLMRFEWFQDYKYLWPLIGFVYIYDGIITNKSRDEKEDNNNENDVKFLVAPFSNSSWGKIVSILCGSGLLIGGAFDAFMPVWMTGPNAFTNAGIHQDSALVLTIVTIVSFLVKEDKEKDRIQQQGGNNNNLLLQMFLVAELYEIGESSIDEVVGTITDLL